MTEKTREMSKELVTAFEGMGIYPVSCVVYDKEGVEHVLTNTGMTTMGGPPDLDLDSGEFETETLIRFHTKSSAKESGKICWIYKCTRHGCYWMPVPC